MAGAGSGLANGALARLAIDSVPHERASMGSAASNTARYIGASIAVAMVVAIASRSAAGNHAAQAAAVTHGATLAILASAVVALMGACLAALLGRARRSETQLAGAGS